MGGIGSGRKLRSEPCPNAERGCKEVFTGKDINRGKYAEHIRTCPKMRKVLTFQGEELELKPPRRTGKPREVGKGKK